MSHALAAHLTGCATCAAEWRTQLDVHALLSARRDVALPPVDDLAP